MASTESGELQPPEPAPAVVYSAALPPHLLEARRKKQEEEEWRRKALEDSAAAEPKKRVMGPSLDALLGGPDDEEAQKDEDEGEEDAIVGPVFYRTPEEAEAARLKALERRRKAQDNLKDETDVKESGAAKKVRRKKAMEKVAKGDSASGKKSSKRRGSKSIDDETDEALEKYNKVMRKETLLQKHVKKRKKEMGSASSSPGYRPWDRERDLTHRPKSAEQRNKMIMDSQALGNRFSHGRGKYKH